MGGSLRAASTSHTALQVALDGAAVRGADADPDGRLKDEVVTAQLRKLGAEVVRAARQFQAEGTCDYADDRPPAMPTSSSS